MAIWIGLWLGMLWGVGEMAAQSGPSNRPLAVRKLGGGWVEAEGQEQVVNIAPEEARRRALQAAREQAIAFAVGIEVQTQTYLRTEEGMREAFVMLSEQTSAGRIVEEKSPEWESFEIPGDPLPIAVYRARVRVKVAEEKEPPDQNFWVKVGINKEQFRPGEEMVLGVTASRPCYVTVLNLTATDTVVVLLPHQYRKDRFVAPGDTLWIPDADEQAMGIHYRVVLPAGREQATEMIKVVATQEPWVFGQGLEKVSIFNQVPTRQAALVELIRWLMQIKRDKRTEAQVVYEVQSAE